MTLLLPIPTPRLILTPFSREHLTPRYVSWLNDPETTRYSEQRHRKHTLESCEAYWRSFEGTPHNFWAIVRTSGAGDHVGNLSAHLDPRHSVADLGILLAKEVWGEGLGTEAWIAACDHLLRVRRVRKVTAGAIEPNEGMLGIMRKAGMTEDGRRIRQHVWEGREVDVVHRAVFRNEWLERHPHPPFSDEHDG